MSQVDDTKYQELKESLRSGFGQSGAMMHEKASVLDGQGSTALDPIVPDDDLSQISPEQVKLVDRAVTSKENLAQQRRAADAENEADLLEKVLERQRTAMATHTLEDDVHAKIAHSAVVVRKVTRSEENNP